MGQGGDVQDKTRPYSAQRSNAKGIKQGNIRRCKAYRGGAVKAIAGSAERERGYKKHVQKYIFCKVRGIYSYWDYPGQCFYTWLLYFFCNQSRYGQAGEATE